MGLAVLPAASASAPALGLRLGVLGCGLGRFRKRRLHNDIRLGGESIGSPVPAAAPCPR